MLSENKKLVITKTLILFFVFCCSWGGAHPGKTLLERAYSFEERMYDLCHGHGEEHMTENQIALLLKDIDENYTQMLNLIDLAKTERFLVRLTNVVVLSDLDLERKNEFYKKSFDRSRKNGEEWRDVIKLLIEKTSALTRENIKNYETSSDRYLRAAAKKALIKQSNREDVRLSQLREEQQIVDKEAVEEKRSSLPWIVAGVLLVGILALLFKAFKGESTS